MEERNYPIYIIYSSWSICKMKDFLDNILPDNVGLLKIVYDTIGNETNKTIVLMSNELYDKLLELGYGTYRYGIDFIIKRYKLGNYILPGENKSNNLFIPTIHKTTELFITTVLTNKLELLVKYNIIPPQSWRIKCPLNSRENGFIKLGCFIFFKPEISDYNIGVVKFLLQNLRWIDGDSPGEKYDNMIKCYWAKRKNK